VRTRRLAALVAITSVISVPGSAERELASAAPIVRYQAIAPLRVLDTRSAIGTSKAGKTTSLLLDKTLRQVPTDAAAVTLNVTVNDPDANGFVTVFPCGTSVPATSNVNFRAGQTIANLVIVRPNAVGAICLTSSTPTHLIADLQGWFPTGTFDPDELPIRTLDTRQTNTRVRGGSETVIAEAGASDRAEVLNATVVDPADDGWLTVYPCGTKPPLASNVNFVAGHDAANLVIARPGETSGGWRVCARASTDVQLVIDHQGQVLGNVGYSGITPMRVFDSRQPIGTASAARLVANKIVEVSFPIAAGMPTTASTAVLNVTATDASAGGFVTVFPCGSPPPTASNVNLDAASTVPNAVVTKIGPRGTVCVFTSSPTHIVIDLQGWFIGDGAPAPASSAFWESHDLAANNRMGYMAYLPPGYTSNPGRTWPTIVFLHGSGEAGTGRGADLARVADVGLPRLLRDNIAPVVARGFIVLSPQIPDSRHDPARLRTWLLQTLPQFSVDRDRTYLTGLSLGGYGVFDYVGAYGDTNEFAAVAPIAGDFTGTVRCAAWERTPLWAFHGELDRIVDPGGAIDTVLTVNDRCRPVERQRITIYGDLGHNSYDPTYDLRGMANGWARPDYNPYSPDLYTWFLTHTRSAYR
jgi:dienelactone hydrolase